jgi:plastocyanin
MSRLAVRGVALAAVVAAGATAALLAIAPAAGKHRQGPSGKTRTVGVTSDFYEPGEMSIHVGDRIKWVWQPSGFALHDVFVDSGPEEFESPTQAAGTFAHRFKKAGTYKLYCTQHEGMTMTLKVKKAPK